MTGRTLTRGLCETLAVFGGSATPLTTTEVAEELDLGRRSTYDRLDRLVDAGELETKKVGASARVWWRPSAALSATDGTELERGTRRFDTLVENFPNGVVAHVDSDLRYVAFGGNLEGDAELSRSEVEDRRIDDVMPPAIADVVLPAYEAALDGTESAFVESIDGNDYRFHFVPVHGDDGDVFAAIGTSQDISDSKRGERRLEERVRQQDVVSELGQRALEDGHVDALFAEAAGLVAETLDNDYCKVLDLDADAEELHLRQGVGWDDGIVGSASVSAVEDDSQAAYTLATETPVVVEDLTTERRFSGPELLTDHDVRSGISTVIGPKDDPWGILGTHDTDLAEVSEHDAAFVQSVANVLASAVERHDHETTLSQQREQLAALNAVNVVVRQITDAVIEDSTRAEIEATVCERLVATDSYQFAWVGEVDGATQTVEPRAAAGGDDYLDDVTISVDPDDERSRGPTGRALRSGTMQVTNNLQSSPTHRPWRSAVTESGFRSSAAIPFVHEGTVYGVLNVYANRENAFGGQEGAVLGHLGEIVGHAIAATERKQALMSDALVALEFRVPDVFASYGVHRDRLGHLAFDHVVSAGDDDYVVFGTCDTDCVDCLEELTDAISSWETVSVHRGDEESTFELLLSDPPLLSVVASLGGYVERAVVADGDYEMTVHLSPSADVRRLTEAVENEFPAVELVSRRQISRERDDLTRFQRDLLEPLTDRQRATLETAHHAGFFEWPREASGEAVAASLGIASPTFHQHLRGAEKAVFDELVTSQHRSED